MAGRFAARARPRRLRRWRARARDGDALGDARPRRAGALRGQRPGRADGDAGARAEAEGDDALRRPLRAVDRRRQRVGVGRARLVLLRERHRGRPGRDRGDAAARRRRVVGLPLLERRRHERARRRRRLPGAVPARLRVGKPGAHVVRILDRRCASCSSSSGVARTRSSSRGSARGQRASSPGREHRQAGHRRAAAARLAADPAAFRYRYEVAE